MASSFSKDELRKEIRGENVNFDEISWFFRFEYSGKSVINKHSQISWAKNIFSNQCFSIFVFAAILANADLEKTR